MTRQRYQRFVGMKHDTTCACGCGQKIPGDPGVVVVVDMDSDPKKRYIPGHDPMSTGTRVGEEMAKSLPPKEPAKTERPKEEKPAPSPSPPQPSNLVKDPEPKRPTEGMGEVRPWILIQVTVSPERFQPIKVAVADYGTEGEDLEGLSARVRAKVGKEIRDAMEMQRSMNGGTP